MNMSRSADHQRALWKLQEVSSTSEPQGDEINNEVINTTLKKTQYYIVVFSHAGIYIHKK